MSKSILRTLKRGLGISLVPAQWTLTVTLRFDVTSWRCFRRRIWGESRWRRRTWRSIPCSICRRRLCLLQKRARTLLKLAYIILILNFAQWKILFERKKFHYSIGKLFSTDAGMSYVLVSTCMEKYRSTYAQTVNIPVLTITCITIYKYWK